MEAINFPLVFQGIIGLFSFLGIGWLLSEDKKNVDFSSAALAVLLQIALAMLTTRVSYVRSGLLWVSQGINEIKNATMTGTSFVFGYLGGADLPFVLKEGGNSFIFAFQPLPMIMVVSALSMLLFHWKVLPVVVNGFSWALRKTLGVGGALGVCAAAKVFLGQTDAPLLIRPYLKSLSRSELFTVMTLGMATTSATIMILYATILEGTIANPISHILTASVINVPAAIAISRVIVPHTGNNTEGDLVIPYEFSSSMDAIAQGANDGLKLFLGIITMLIVALASVAIINSMLGLLPHIAGEAVSLERILGVVLAPIIWMMGIPWQEAFAAGNVLGTKAVLNEVMGFLSLSKLPPEALGPRTNLMMTYALCGFANFSSIGILIGGLGGMAPERRGEIVELGFKALIAGTMASCMSGTVVGLLWWLS